MSPSLRRMLAISMASLLLLLGACGDDGEGSGSSSTSGPKVVASTSWVGAIAKLAGATDIKVIAPSNIQHPPDYEPKASDLTAVKDADFVLMAGFEKFAARLADAAGSKAKKETVVSEYDSAKLSAEVRRLAGLFGTTDAAEKNLTTYLAQYEKAAADTKVKLGSKKPVVVAQAFVGVWAGFAGLQPAAVYGMEKPPSADEVAAMVKLKPSFVFENSHMPLGADVVSATGAKKIDLVNYPGADLDLLAVVDKNAKAIVAAIA